MMKYEVFRYFQGTSEFISLILPFKVVMSTSSVLQYSKDSDYGYQRSINATKAQSIKKAIIRGDLVSPTSIILGLDREKSDNILFKEENRWFINISENIDMFRIIDGQHRLEGFKLASIENEKYKNYELNIVIVIIEKNRRSKEVEIFHDINSKGVRVKTDLAILAKYNYEFLEGNETIDVFTQIAVNSIFEIVLYTNSIWRNGIKLDVNDKSAPGIIGFKSYFESLLPIVKVYFNDFVFEKGLSLKDINAYAIEFNEKVHLRIWEIIENKWGNCFTETHISIEDTRDIIRYNEFYFIQKTVGTKAVFTIFLDCLKNNSLSDALNMFERIINKSSLSYDDWGKNRVFDGLSSLSGMKVIVDIIKNGRDRIIQY